jgi:hypothetical protein
MFVALGLFQLLVYSLVGTIVEVKVNLNFSIYYSISISNTFCFHHFQNEHFFKYVCDIQWYALPIVEQKKVLLMLAKCQKPKEYTIADQVPLNFDTCVRVWNFGICFLVFIIFIPIFQILKTVYSFFMMLLETL